MANPDTSDRTAAQRVVGAAKALVAVLGIVLLSYLTVTSMEHSLALRDAAYVATPPSSEASSTAVACASFPDMTCPSRQVSTTSGGEPVAPTF